MAKKKTNPPSKSTARKVPVVAPRRSPGLLTIIVPLVLGLLVALIWVTALLVSKDDEPTVTPPPAEPSPTAPPATYPTGTSRPGGSVDAQRKQLSSQALELLKQAKELAARPDLNSLIADVARGDESGLPKDFVAKFRFVDKVQEEEEIRAAGLISLLQLGQVLNNSIPDDVELELLTPEAYKFIYVDMEAGNAYVPFSLYLGKDAAFSFEYVWVGKEWVFSPYSLIDAISAADTAAKGAQLGTSE